MAIIDFFDRGWAMNGQAIAYIQDDQSVTFDEAGTLSCQIANRLLALDCAKGVKAAVWAGNDVTAWICTLGIWRAGLTWIPVNARNAADDNLYILNAFDCEVLFYQQAFADTVAALRPKLPAIRHWICIDADLPEAPSLAAWCGTAPCSRPEVDSALDEIFIISSTGGTTGVPKGVMNSHRAAQTTFIQFMLACTYRDGTRPVNLAAAPLTHSAGLLSIPCTAQGGTVVVLSKPDPKLLVQAIAKHHVTELFLPPTVIYALLEAPGIDQADFSSLRYLLYGAAPMSVEKLKKAIALWGPIMTESYGQTEAMGSIATLRADEHMVGGQLVSDEQLASVGRPNPLVRVEIMDAAGRILPRGETGEICVRGDLMMSGYYKDPEKTAETIVDGWLHTGDVGHIDHQGFLHLTDRKKDMIISGGFNVYPAMVEQVLWAHPAVQDCAVIGVPDEKWGEAVKAVVELNPGQSVKAEELIALCKEKLGSVVAPKTIDFVDRLPRSAAGKVLKKDLRAAYWQGQASRI